MCADKDEVLIRVCWKHGLFCLEAIWNPEGIVGDPTKVDCDTNLIDRDLSLFSQCLVVNICLLFQEPLLKLIIPGWCLVMSK